MGIGFEKFDDLEKILPEQLQITGRKLQCLVCGVILVLVAICMVLAVSLGLHVGGRMGPCSSASMAHQAATTSGACVTSECLSTAAYLAENLDTKSDPCQDFFQFSCGGWMKRHTVPPDAGDVTVVRNLRLANDERIREIMDQPVERDEPESSERKLKHFFRMCNHDYGRMKEGGRALWSLIRQHVKGWYAQDPENWMKNGWNLNEAISDVQGELNVGILVKIRIALDWVTQAGMIWISSGGTGLPYTYYTRQDKEGVQEAYKDYMRSVAVLLLRDANVTMTTSEQNRRVEQFVQDAYGQELHLAEILRDLPRGGSERRPRVLTMRELEDNFTQLPWRQIVGRSFEGFDVVSSTKVRLSIFGYFVKINELLRNETADKDRIMNNYIVWRLLHTYSQYLSWEYKHAALRYYELTYGIREFTPTWEKCVSITRQTFGSALFAEFLKKHSSKETKLEVEKMFKYIKSALFNSIDNLRWMDNDTKARAQEKVAAINKSIGFPDSYLDDAQLDKIHAKLRINLTDGFFRSYINVQRFRRSLRAQELQGDAAIRGYMRFGGTGSSLPLYLWRTNHLLVPPAAIQFPLFGLRAPEFFNFGGLGSQIADQIINSINQKGRYMWTNNSVGRWWSADTFEKYKNVKNCFRDYFDGIQVGPFVINGENKTVRVLGDRQSSLAADVVAGIRIAFKAYHNWVKDAGHQLLPVGTSLTPDQAFFVSATQTQCFVRTDEAAYFYAKYQYMPENVLYNIVLSHMPEFAKVFKCQPGSRMVANNTCNVY